MKFWSEQIENSGGFDNQNNQATCVLVFRILNFSATAWLVAHGLWCHLILQREYMWLLNNQKAFKICSTVVHLQTLEIWHVCLSKHKLAVLKQTIKIGKMGKKLKGIYDALVGLRADILPKKNPPWPGRYKNLQRLIKVCLTRGIDICAGWSPMNCWYVSGILSTRGWSGLLAASELDMGSAWLAACILDWSGIGIGCIWNGGTGNLGPIFPAATALDIPGPGIRGGYGIIGRFMLISIPNPIPIPIAGMYCCTPGYIIGSMPHPIDIIYKKQLEGKFYQILDDN